MGDFFSLPEILEGLKEPQPTDVFLKTKEISGTQLISQLQGGKGVLTNNKAIKKLAGNTWNFFVNKTITTVPLVTL